MSVSEIRTELHELIDKLDGRFLRAIHQMINAYQSEGEEVSDEEKEILDSRLEQHKTNPNEGRPWTSIKSDLLG